jgi:hypothetical protein
MSGPFETKPIWPRNAPINGKKAGLSGAACTNDREKHGLRMSNHALGSLTSEEGVSESRRSNCVSVLTGSRFWVCFQENIGRMDAGAGDQSSVACGSSVQSVFTRDG